MKHLFRALVSTVVAFAAGSHVHSAQLATESFTSGLNGWTNSVDGNKWVATNQAARVDFSAEFLPLSASLETGPNTSGGSFTGNVASAGAEVIGFSLLCLTVQPSTLKLELTSGTNSIFQDLRPRLRTIGSWNYLFCPLTGSDSDRWVGLPASQIPAFLTNIQRVAIRVFNSGTMLPQSYILDDFFLDRLPSANSLAAMGTNATEMSWTNLRTNFTYRMEFTDSLTSGWTSVTAFTATSTVLVVTHTNPTPLSPAFYRLFAP